MDPRTEIQRIYEKAIRPELEKQKGEKFVSISLSQKELKAICNFFDTFAYD